MKQTIWITMLVSLWAQLATAQTTLPASLQPYAAYLQQTLHPSIGKVVLSGQPDKTPAVAERTNPVRLDSTKTFFNYSPGLPIDSTALYRSRYQYPQNGVQIQTNEVTDGIGWAPTDRVTYTRDQLERTTNLTAELYDPETGVYHLDSKLEIFPHGNSPVLIDSFIVSLWDSTILDWHVILYQTNKFDAQDRLEESTSALVYFGDAIIFNEIYSYNGNGDNHLVEEYAVLGNDVFPSSRTEKAYANHLLIESAIYVVDTLGWIPQTRINYAYTLFDSLRKEMTFEWNVASQNWRLAQTKEWLYDQVNRLSSEQVTVIPENAYEERTLTVYAYNNANKLYHLWSFYWDDELFDWKLDTKKYYYYNSLVAVDPDPGAGQVLTVTPNPTTGFVQLNVEAAADVQIFDSTGKRVGMEQVQPGQALDLSTLPEGVYVLGVRQGSKFFTSKIVRI